MAVTAIHILGFAMSLADNAQVRKARLLALRKRRAGETVEDESVKKNILSILSADNNRVENAEPLIKSRNFDPETRTLKKRGNDEDVEMEDTVEKNVEGLAEQIIKEDTEKRAQELVCVLVAPLVGMC